MKVLYITNIPSPYRVDFFNELGKYCDLTVLYERDNAVDRDVEWLNNNAEYFNVVFLKGKKIGSDAAFCPSVIRWLKSDAFDLFVIGGYSTPTGMLAIKYLNKKNKPFILNSDGGFIKKDSKLKHNLKKYFISSGFAWLSTGEYTKKYLLHYGANIEHIYTYPFTSVRKNEILKQRLTIDEKEKIKERLGIKENKIVVSVGQYIHRKGFDILLKACEQIDRTTGVYIIGGYPTDEYLEIKNTLNLNNVHFINFKSKEKLKEYYMVADLFVLPTREDIWGLVINEAMAHGLPIITTDKCIAGLELIKDYENGFIVPIENSNELAKKIQMLINNYDLQIKMARNNLQKIRDYTIENMAKRHMEIFHFYHIQRRSEN